MIEERTGNRILESVEILRHVERSLGGFHNFLHRNGFEATLHYSAPRAIVDLPLRWRNPRSIFIN